MESNYPSSFAANSTQYAPDKSYISNTSPIEPNQKLGEVIISHNNNTYFDSKDIRSGFYDLENDSISRKDYQRIDWKVKSRNHLVKSNETSKRIKRLRIN